MIVKIKKETGVQWIDKNLFVWESNRTERGPIYTIQESLENGEKIHTTVYGNVAGCEITAGQALDLYKGVSVDHCTVGQKPCTLVPADVGTSVHEKNGKTYNNRVLNVNVAWHMLRKNTKEVFAYRCGNEVFLKENHVGSFDAELNPADCFTLKTKGHLSLGRFELTYERNSILDNVEHTQTSQENNISSEPVRNLDPYHLEMMKVAQIDLTGEESYLKQALTSLGSDKFEEIIGETKGMVLEGQKIKKTPTHVFIHKLKIGMQELPESKKVIFNNFTSLHGNVKQEGYSSKMRAG